MARKMREFGMVTITNDDIDKKSNQMIVKSTKTELFYIRHCKANKRIKKMKKKQKVTMMSVYREKRYGMKDTCIIACISGLEYTYIFSY